MPGRVARQITSAPKNRTARKRSEKKIHDAFSIAAHSASKSKKGAIPRHRLGEIENDNSAPKRRRNDDEDEDEDEDGDGGTRREQNGKRARTSHGDDDEIEYGSDSEGHEWHTGGPLEGESDSDIDSDEAFGEGDEERYEGFTFRGSASEKKQKKSRRSQKDDDDMSVDLNEDESAENSDGDGLGESAVDLATMLDDDHVSEVSTSEMGSDEDDSDRDAADESDTDVSDEDKDTDDPEKLAKLQDLVASLESGLGEQKRSAGIDTHEAQAPSAYGLTSTQKLRVADLLPTVKDPALRKSLKVLAADKPSKRSGIPGKLQVPVSKREQLKLDRIAAMSEAKETLERWRDTVIQNRRAEHLQFPLVDPDAQEPMGTKRLVAVQQDKPQTELESAIQDILEASGLADKRVGGGDEESRLQQAESLQTNKMPVEEVMARRAELRRARELLFREEVRAKRVKRIKSKSYRRVHRREREKQKQLEAGYLDPDGNGMDDDEKERQDRRRATERMGAKHRECKWSKEMKQSGRTVWDDDAREGIIGMARRNEELRKRIEGKEVDGEAHDASSGESFHSSDDDSEDDDPQSRERRRLGKQVDRLAESGTEKATSRLGSMAFMQRADAARKRQNDDTINEIRRDLAAENGETDEQDKPDTQLGRRIFGPAPGTAQPKTQSRRPEMEERPASDDENDVEIKVDAPATASTSAKSRDATKSKQGNRSALSRGPVRTSAAEEIDHDDDDEDDPWLTAATGNKKSQSKSSTATEFIPAPAALEQVQKPKAKANKSAPSSALVPRPDSAEKDEEHDKEIENGMLSAREQQAAYHARAFAGDEADTSVFEAEKTNLAADEDDKVISHALPGWGAWAGEGLTKSVKRANAAQKERNRHNPLLKTKVDGVRPADRRDAKLKNVIISEAQERKGKKYLASQLPHEYEKKAQYERAMRIPIGQEWTTKDTFQRNTKPRVIVKQGVIAPMSKPMI